MTKVREVYRCPICGNIVEVLHEGAILSCCGKPMQLLSANSTDGAFEKHVPVIERMPGGFKVRVGSTEHPMTKEHYIQWIEWLTPKSIMRCELHPGDKPEAVFLLDSKSSCDKQETKCDLENVSARAFCNLHGLWGD